MIYFLFSFYILQTQLCAREYGTQSSVLTQKWDTISIPPPNSANLSNLQIASGMKTSSQQRRNVKPDVQVCTLTGVSVSKRVLVETFQMKMSLIYVKMNLYAEHVFIWMVLDEDSFWHRGKSQLGNDLFATLLPITFVSQMAWILAWYTLKGDLDLPLRDTTRISASPRLVSFVICIGRATRDICFVTVILKLVL